MLTKTESRGLALARGFIVCLIAPIHCVMMYSNTMVKTGWLGAFMAFFAEYPGAHLFMFLMGFFIVLSKRKPLKIIFKRTLALLVAGYLLNSLKFVLPHLLGWLPAEFYSRNHIVRDDKVALRLLLINDILQFASLAYLLCGLIRKLSAPLWIIMGLALLLLFVTPLMWDKGNTDNLLLNGFLDVLGGSPPRAYFPVFPWLFHSLLGMSYGLLLKRFQLKKIFFLMSGLVFMGLGAFIVSTEPSHWQQSFFRAGPGGTLFHSGATIIFISLFVVIAERARYFSALSALEWYSKNITPVYLVQWVLIMWFLPVTGYEQLGNAGTLMMITVVSLLTFFIVKMYAAKT